jgi:methyl-accepting chemotaxis protein
MKNWSLNAKIGFVIGVLAVGAIVISYFGITKMSYINDNLTTLAHVDVKRDQKTGDILDAQRMVSLYMRDAIIESDPVKIQKIQEQLLNAKKELQKAVNDYSEISAKEGKDLSTQYLAVLDKWYPVITDVMKLAKQNKAAEVSALREHEEAPLLEKVRAIVNQMNDLTAKRLTDAVKESNDSYIAARNLVTAISIFSIVAGMLLALVIMRSVSKSIDQVISNLNDNSSQVTSAAQQIAASSEQLSQAATEQASSLEETASSIEEMNSMVQKNSENARKSSEISTTSHESASKGKEVVQEMIRAIEDINASNQQIAEIVKVIGDIGNKTKVINYIVFQTKLLSFNASVEAARAGEHGKGFAVVAEEVGKLAQMSGNAAKEISTMLDGSMLKVEGIVNETKVKVETGTKIAQQCGEVLGDIVTNVSSVNQMVGEISTACQEQSQGVQEITKAMSQLDQVTQENASTSEEAASAAEELAAQAESLRGVVRMLVQTIKGGEQGGAHHGGGSGFELAAQKPKEAHPAAHAEGGKVVHLKNSAAKKGGVKVASHHPQGPELKKAAGMESSVPSEQDPRFNDV